jgi:hypothetical protein
MFPPRRSGLTSASTDHAGLVNAHAHLSWNLQRRVPHTGSHQLVAGRARPRYEPKDGATTSPRQR